jgi:large subunit ribosomal protein L15
LKLHDLQPAPGSRKARTRVGRGIAAGKGKTAGRGTKGQKARAGGSIPPWFEGGQTPIHVRVPKLRGFKRHGRVEYQVVNIGRISAYAESGRFGADADTRAPVTVNGEILRAAGLVASAGRPIKVLGGGDVSVKLFIAVDAVTASARRKVEEAGGFIQPLATDVEAPVKTKRGPAARAARAAEAAAATAEAASKTRRAPAGKAPKAAEPEAEAASQPEAVAEAAAEPEAEAASKTRRAPAGKAPKAAQAVAEAAAEPEAEAASQPEAVAEAAAEPEAEAAAEPQADAPAEGSAPETDTDTPAQPAD